MKYARYFVLLAFLLAPVARAEEWRFSDCHLHYVDFVMESGGIQSLVRAMDQGRIEHTMICGLPVVKKWGASEPRRPHYYLSDGSPTYYYSMSDVLVAQAVKSLEPAQQKRFHPFINGFNPTDRNAIDHVKRMVEMYPNFWQGIGEVLTRHDDLAALTEGERARANHLAMAPVYDYAAEHDLPVWIHANATAVYETADPEPRPIYLKELEDAVGAHPRTRFVWCHAGISRRIVVPNLTDLVGQLLDTYPNLWIDLSWVVYDDYVAPRGKPAPQWVALIEKYPGRFLIGSDQVGHFETLPQTMARYIPLLEKLSPDTARKLARDNFLGLLPAWAR